MILGVNKFGATELIGVSLEGSLNFWNLEGGETQSKQLNGHHVGHFLLTDCC